MRLDREYLGVGWKFPIQTTPDGKIAQAKEEQRIEESVYLILATSKGERAMKPEFGCGLQELVFAPNNASTRARVAFTVRQALVASEPRIDVMEVGVDATDEEPNLLLIRVDYRIRANNARGNLVYPFFVTEGS
ncbi:baseplate protein [bacterium]|nr:MAG: baseplate protein [bacterium]